MKSNLSKNIVYYRKLNKLSQSDLAKELFVTPQAVSRWENETNEPDIDTLNKMAEIFNVSVNELINGPENHAFKTITHILYLIFSALMIILSLLLIFNRDYQTNPAIRWVFLTLALAFLFFVLISEIIMSYSKRKKKKK